MMPFGTQPSAAEIRDGLVRRLVLDLQKARARHDATEDQILYLLDRYEITPKGPA